MVNWNDAKTLSYEEKRKIELMSYEEIIDIGQKLCKYKQEVEKNIENEYHNWISINIVLSIIAEVLIERIDSEMKGTFLGLADNSMFLS